MRLDPIARLYSGRLCACVVLVLARFSRLQLLLILPPSPDIGWYEDGGLNESTLALQVEVMSTRLRVHGWDTILHDYGWQVCGSTFHVHDLSNR